MRANRFLVAAIASVMVCVSPAGATGQQPQPFLGGLSFPTNMAFLPDGSLLFTEKQTGSVRVVTPDGELLDRPFITLPVIPDAERGLLGIAVHPDFEQEPWIYLYRSDPADGLNRLIRVRANGVVAAGESQIVLDGISAVAGYHNGGDLVFGLDGTLFVALGEAHEADRAQDEDDIGGKIVRLTADGGVPNDNPFGPDNPAWSVGHRNSFGLCVDPESGRLWETENGPDRDDEVNLIEAGGNYGWPEVTGAAGDDRFLDPIVVFPQPIALTGCAVAEGDVWFGSFDGRLWRLPDAARGGDADEVASFPTGVTDVAIGPDHLLYVATADAIWTLSLRGGPPSVTTVTPTPGEPGESPSSRPAATEGDDEGGAWRRWIAVGAGVLLCGALIARLAAGRGIRRRSRNG